MNAKCTLTPDQIVAYHRDGYLHVPGFMDAGELAPVQQAIVDDPSIGGRLGWVRHGDDWLGTCTRLERIVESAATLIGEPVYHFHSKIVQKPAKRSGKVVWHQDYGGWYQDGCNIHPGVGPLIPPCIFCMDNHY